MSGNEAVGAPNAAQIDYWNMKGNIAWVPLQQRIDAMLTPMGTAMLEAARLEEGHRVLDIGCGCGHVTLEAAGVVGPAGMAVGVDISRPMIARARQRADGLDHVRFVVADAQTADISALAVDRIISRFGVMFFSQPVAAFSNLRSGLTEGGQITFICWQTASDNPWMSFGVRAVEDFIDLDPPAPDGPGPFSLGDIDKASSVLAEAKFTDIEVESLVGEIVVGGGGSVEDVVEFSIRMSPLRDLVANDADLGQRVNDRLTEVIEQRLVNGTFLLPFSCWVVTALKS